MDRIIYTAIFGNYEELKEPTIVTPGWRYICYTDQPLKSRVWEIIQKPLIDTPQRTARYYKILGMPDGKSIWVDGSFTIACDLNKFWAYHFLKPFSCPSHPIRRDVFLEADACIRNKRGNAHEIQKHINKYKGVVPRNNGLISSGLLLRENNESVKALCESWHKEVQENSTRDQISFARVSLGIGFIHTFKWDYRSNKDFIFKTHYHRR